MKTIGVSFVVFLVAGLCPGLSPSARAGEATSEGKGAETRTVDAKTAAHEHFDRGLAASNAQRFGEAADEFKKAYELWPDYKVLYNIGRVRLALGQPVEVVDAYEAYLAQGDKEIADDRRDEVKRDLETQRARIAMVSVQTTAGADVRLDGRLIGRAPLPGPLRVAAGQHTLEAFLPDRPAQVAELDLQGGVNSEAALTFPPRPDLGVPAPAAAVSLLETPRGPPRNRRTMGYVVGGVGAALLLAGAIVAVESSLAANDAKARLVTAATPPTDVAEYDAAKHTYDDAKTRNQLGWAIGGVGVAALAGGAAMVYLSSGASPARADRDVTANVVVQPGGLAVRGKW